MAHTARVVSSLALRRSLAFLLISVAFAAAGSQSPNAIGQAPLPLDPSAAPINQTTLRSVLDQGADFENNRQWSDAIRHYEKASREFPNNRQIYQRLIISRLHYDVNRRYRDPSYVESTKSMTSTQALDLYVEVLANLETHYVERIEWSRLLLHGTAALEIALTEARFTQNALPNTDPARVQAFQESIHRRITDRPALSRFDLRATVAHVANLANAELGLSPTTVILEYVSGAISTLDPYTRLLSPDQLDDMFSNIEGNFVGLGVELETTKDSLKILSVIPGGPAEEAGLLAGQHIVQVENAATKDSPEIAADLLRGPENSRVAVSIRSVDGSTRDLSVSRRRVEVPCVENAHIADPIHRIGYLRLTNFQKTTPRDIERAIWNLRQQGMQGLVLDLRGNPGGLLSAAVELADRFIDRGRIVTTKGRNSRENFQYTAHPVNTMAMPLAVLIDSDSASASEIFAGAIADNRRGVVVGERSYGKGSVQGIFRMQSAKFGLCLTTAKFYSPSGTAISQNGVRADLAVDSDAITGRPADDGHVFSDLEDEVLQAAVERLANQGRLISQRP
ncbi:MAG: S41 family peptidase [Planctomycetota bacterium]